MKEVRKSGFLRIIPFILIVVLFCTFTQGKTIYVDNDGQADFDNIQAGIDASIDGDTVLVADGTYTGDGNRDLDFNGKAIMVISENGAEVTIIDCQGREEEPHRGFYFHSGETLSSVVDGFTIKNGYGPLATWPSGTWSVGGGIYCTNSSPMISNNIITGNTAMYGGGIQCWEHSSPRITNNVITRNSSREGAGIWCYNYCSATIRNNTITENIAGWGGGGIKIDLASSAEVVNNVIAENSAQWKGGGIYCGNSSPVIINSTLSANSSQHEGGGIYIWGNASPLIVNTILWGDSPEEIVLGGGGSFIITYSCVQGGWPGAGNINADPLFLDAANGDYRLLDGSACINAGDNSAFPRSLVEDIDGYPRITDSIADIGAYEFGIVTIPDEAKYSGGTGEPNDPYQIATAEDLMLLGESPEDNGKHFILTADIDLDPNLPGRKVFDRAVVGPYTYVVAEGWQGMPFTGVFDGNGKKIYNFSYTSTDRNCVGLFGTVDDPNAQIINLGLVNPDIEAGTRASVGSLVGWLKTGRIVGCCVEDGSVSGRFYVGGLVGQNGGTIINSYSTGNISGNDNVGGLIGGNTGTVDGCYSTCNVMGTRNVGGLVGQNGDIVGWSLIMYSGTIFNCYSTGSVSGHSVVGGLVGIYYVGTTTNCYATGKVLGNKYVGGLVGSGVFGLGEVEACFWDIETSGLTSSGGGIGLTTAEMQTASTFINAGWDFVGEIDNGTEDIWWIDEGRDYPRLWWEPFFEPDDGVLPDIDLIINNPIPDERFVIGEEIIFSVTVSGQPDLDGLQLEWTSDIDGFLGTGLGLTVDNLSAGSHVIEVWGYGACASISVRIYEDLWQLYQAPPAEGEIDRILNDFTFNLIDGDKSDEKWDAYDHDFNQNSTEPSLLVAISKLDILRHQRFSKPVPFTKGRTRTIYEHFKTYVKTINLKLDCSYNSAGGDQVNLNRNFSVWDGRVSGTPSNWDACKTPFTNYSLFQYTKPIYLLMHEVRHCEPSDPGHRTCNDRASDEMFEDGGGYAQSALYLMWVYKYSLYDPLFIRNEAGSTATMFLKDRICTTPTHSDPSVQAIIDELLN
jgi:hypothetical protein